MASITELYTDEQNLIIYHQELGEELERMRGIRSSDVRAKLIEKIQIRMFEMALKLSFPSVKKL